MHKVHGVRRVHKSARVHARFARIAKASEQEVLNHLYRARNKGYIPPAEFEEGLGYLARR